MNWLFTTFRSGRRMQQMLSMFGMGKRRNNRSLLFSIVGLGLGAAAISMMRGRNMQVSTITDPIQQAMGDMGIRNPIA